MVTEVNRLSPATITPGALVNAQASWTDPSDHYTVAVFVNNITNTRFQLVTSGGSFGDYRQFNQPVSAGGRLSYRF